MDKYLCQKYPCNHAIDVLGKQVLKSGTSIFANVSESVNAQSTNDFISKLNIALKEADETKGWLELLHGSEYISDDEFESVYDDNEKIRAILIKIILKMKQRKE